MHKLKIADIDPITPSLLLVRLGGDAQAFHEGYKLPGMRATLHAGTASGAVPIASQPGRPEIEVLVERKTALGDALARLPAGAEVELSGPAGTGFPAFDFRGDDLYVLGHGSGIGAMRAVLLHALVERGAFLRVCALVQSHYMDEIPFRDEFPAWQRGGARLYQSISRPDVGKWKRGEQAYVHDLLADLRPDPARSVVFAAGSPDMLQGVQGVLRAIELPPERLYLFELEAAERERAIEPERPRLLLDKVTKEGIYGSGHQKDAPDHSPSYATPHEQPVGAGLAPYQRH
jgi:NAD(P)H-flavin reductase